MPQELAKKGIRHKLQWTEEEVKAFQALKDKLAQRLALQTADPDRPFILKVDASDYAIGAVLEQLPHALEDPS